MYPIKLSVRLIPVWHSEMPLIKVGIPGNVQKLYLDKSTTFNFEYTAENISSLTIEFLNKTDSDCILDKNLDKAVIIEDISFFGISDPKFIWAGVYTPLYPNHIIDQPVQLTNLKYLGFNGQWRLDFTVPIFTWMHKVQNLGWIYD